MLSAALSAGTFASSSARRFQPAVATNGSTTLRLFQQVQDLVNGPSTNLVRIHVGAGIDEPWRWASDTLFTSMPLGDSATVTEDALKTRICCEAALHSLKLRNSGVPEEKARSMGIALAASRVASRRAWGFTDADTVITQRMTVTVHPAVAAAAGPPVVAAEPAGLSANGVSRGRLFAGALGTSAAFAAELALCVTAYENASDTVIPKIMLVAIGMPACNGAVLVITLGHHYVDPHKQICNAVFTQFFKEGDAMLPGMSKDEMMDVCCHKAAHVIETPRLVGMARSDEVRIRLETIGQGSAIVRLPAKFDAERAALALQAVVRKGKAATRKANVVVDTTPVDTLVTAVTAEMEAHPNAQGTLAAKGKVTAFKEEHGFGVAWLAGYLKAMYDDINASDRARSAITAKTLEGVMEDFEEAVAEGTDHFMLAQKWRKTRAKEGFLDGYGLFGADAPKAFGAPEDPPDAANTPAITAGPGAGP